MRAVIGASGTACGYRYIMNMGERRGFSCCSPIFCVRTSGYFVQRLHEKQGTGAIATVPQPYGATRRTCGHFVHKWHGFGGTPTSRFFRAGRRGKIFKYALCLHI